MSSLKELSIKHEDFEGLLEKAIKKLDSDRIIEESLGLIEQIVESLIISGSI